MLIERLRATGKRFYCVLFSMRSGSTAVCEDLRALGLGAPSEHYQVPLYREPGRPTQVAEYIVRTVESTPGDWYGFKASWDQVFALTEHVRIDGEPTAGVDLRAIFPDLQVIHLVRENKLLQAVSLWRALHSNRWHRSGADPEPPPPPEYRLDELRQLLCELAAEDWQWSHHLTVSNTEHLLVRYEDYVDDRVGTIGRIADYLGTSSAELPERNLVPMRDDWSAELARRLWADLCRPTAEWPSPNAGDEAVRWPRLLTPGLLLD